MGKKRCKCGGIMFFHNTWKHHECQDCGLIIKKKQRNPLEFLKAGVMWVFIHVFSWTAWGKKWKKKINESMEEK
jgi:hypothetical protein